MLFEEIVGQRQRFAVVADAKLNLLALPGKKVLDQVPLPAYDAVFDDNLIAEVSPQNLSAKRIAAEIGDGGLEVGVEVWHGRARSRTLLAEVVDLLADEYGWSDSVSNLSNKLQRESLRYTKAVQLADVLGFEIVWQKRRDK